MTNSRKRILSLFLALVMGLSLCACGDEEAPKTTAAQPVTTEATQAPTTEATEPAPEAVVYKLGDVIETEQFKITPSFTGYAKAVANWPDENYLTPAGKMDNADKNPYAAGEGKVQMYGQMEIEYIGNEKQNVSLEIGLSVNYDDGYVFEGVDMGHCLSLDEDWDYDETMTFEPLSSFNTRILRYCIEVPEQVETNRDKSLLVTILVNDEAYVYDFRSAEVLGSDYDPRGEFYQPVEEETKNQIVAYLKANGLEEMGWYPPQTVGVYTFTFGDTTVTATLPINSNYAYDFSGTYEVFSGTILLNWDHGEQMHLDYTWDGTTLEIVEFDHDR